MTCRCTSKEQHAARAVAHAETASRSTNEKLVKERDIARQELANLTPDASQFEVVDVMEVNGHLVLKVRYASCARCAFEGTKIMVYLGASALHALRWRRIDPHFTDKKPATAQDAPAPSARFPATPGGWSDAVAYCHGKDQR